MMSAAASPSPQVAGVPFVAAPAQLLATAKQLGAAPAYYERGASQWEPTSWSSYADQVRCAASALIALGVQPGEAVCILGFNRPEWVIMDHAAMMIGAVAAGIYWTSAASEVEYIIDHSHCAVLLAENETQWAKVADRRSRLPRLQRVVMMRGTQAGDAWQLSWDDFLALGEPKHQTEVDRRLAALKPDDLGTLIYTSGTTGAPKAVMLSHGNLMWTSAALTAAFGANPADRLISYLPLAGTEVRIADDGEILVRGPHVFQGYMGRPEDTAQTLVNGWLHTGDLGRFDDDGYLYVSGRKKDLLITSGGKNISPANIEAELMDLPLVEHGVVCGDGRHFLSALLTLKPEALKTFLESQGITAAVGAEACRHPRVLAELQKGIDAINQNQARVAWVRKFTVLDEPLSVDTGGLTATMKIKRQAVIERHREVVEKMYAD